MPLPLLIPAIGALASFVGGLFGNKSKQTSSTTPTLDPAYTGLRDLLLKTTTDRLNNGSLPSGYETGGIQSINHAYDTIAGTQANSLTARGLARSPIAGVVDTNRDLARAGEVGRFQANLPLVQRDLQNQDLNMANLLLNHGYGQTSTSSGTVGGGIGGGLSDLGSMLGFLIAQGAFKPSGG